MPLTLFRVGLNVLNLSRILGSDILFLLRPHRLVRSRTQGFHPWNRGSNPLGVMSSATPRSRSRRVSFCLMYFLLSATVFAESPPASPSMLAEVPEHQDPRSSAMGTALSQARWEAPIPPVPWGDAQIGASVQVQGRLIQLGGFPQPWRDLEEWFLQTQHGTLAVYMRVPSHRPELGSLIKIEGWRWPSVAVEGRGGRRVAKPRRFGHGEQGGGAAAVGTHGLRSAACAGAERGGRPSDSPAGGPAGGAGRAPTPKAAEVAGAVAPWYAAV